MSGIGFDQVKLHSQKNLSIVEGSDSQVVNIKLEPGEKVRSEQGVMMHMHPDVKMSVEMNPCCGLYAALSGKVVVKILTLTKMLHRITVHWFHAKFSSQSRSYASSKGSTRTFQTRRLHGGNRRCWH